MKLVVILSRVPWPLEKGDKLRAYHQLAYLHSRHEVTLCCLSEVDTSPEMHAALQRISTAYHIFKLQRWRTYLQLVLALFSRKPFQVKYFYQRGIHRQIAQVIRTIQPDHIYCQLIRTSEYAKHEHAYPKTLDYQDAFSKGLERRAATAHWPARELFQAECRRLIAYETVIFEYFEAKTIISDTDRKHIYHPSRKDIVVVANGIDTHHFQPRPREKKHIDLLFTGNMAYPPNVETALYLAREVLPRVRDHHPQLQLMLAGSTPVRQVRALAKLEGVQVTGWVDDIADSYAAARIFVAPMQLGAGLQNKLLEAMAMELPCITSALVNTPLKATHGRELYVASDTEELLEYIYRLLGDENLRLSMGRAARSFVMKHFSWSASARLLEETMLAQNHLTPV